MDRHHAAHRDAQQWRRHCEDVSYFGCSCSNHDRHCLRSDGMDTSTKKCTIVDKKPTTTPTVVVGDGKVFETRTKAETGMKTEKVCAK